MENDDGSDSKQVFPTRWFRLVEKLQAAALVGDITSCGDLFYDIQALRLAYVQELVRKKVPEQDVQDLVAIIFVNFYQALIKPQHVLYPGGLLTTIVKARIIDFYRQRVANREDDQDAEFWEDRASMRPKVGRQDITEAWAGDPYIQVAHEEESQCLKSIVDELPPLLRQVFIARYYEELSVLETCEKLQLTEDKVKKATRAALGELKTKLTKRGLYDEKSIVERRQW